MFLVDITMIYPLVICYIAIENGPCIVELPIGNDDFSIENSNIAHLICYDDHFPTIWACFKTVSNPIYEAGKMMINHQI